MASYHNTSNIPYHIILWHITWYHRIIPYHTISHDITELYHIIPYHIIISYFQWNHCRHKTGATIYHHLFVCWSHASPPILSSLLINLIFHFGIAMPFMYHVIICLLFIPYTWDLLMYFNQKHLTYALHEVWSSCWQLWFDHPQSGSTQSRRTPPVKIAMATFVGFF